MKWKWCQQSSRNASSCGCSSARQMAQVPQAAAMEVGGRQFQMRQDVMLWAFLAAQYSTAKATGVVNFSKISHACP